MLARLHLAAALRSSGEVLWSALDVASSEVGPHGKLSRASGEQQGGLDLGLRPLVWPMHQKSSTTGVSCQVSCQVAGKLAKWCGSWSCGSMHW